MPQNPGAATIAKNSSNAQVALQTSPVGALRVSGGGASATLNVTAAAVIKSGAGVLNKIIVIAPGSGSGSLTVNDLAATTGGAAANQLFTIGFAALSVGQVITLDVPVVTGIAVTAVPGAGSPQFVVVYS